ncbi:MAG: hypothetical protein ACK53Y_05285, partial [bacterium]
MWTGVSPIERALVECCNSSIDDENDSLFISSGKELEFVSICAVYCESVADRSLAIAIFQRVNQKCIQNQGHQNDSPDSSIEMPSHIQWNFILSNGGLEVFIVWLVESTKSLEVIGEAAPLSR